MKRIFSRIIAAAAILATGSAIANPIPVTYDITDYSTSGFSASLLHGAEGCSSLGPNGDRLYMCGSPHLDMFGNIDGSLEGGVLTITGGILNIGGTDYDVLGGSLGGNNPWTLSIEEFGEFLFEGFDMGTGRPNSFDGDTMILWGQNEDAYACNPAESDCSQYNRWGMDLYGEARVQVPEPGTLALFGIGLLGLALTSRRRKLIV